jgi:BirA family transcriptional regulator, biotin operon repressor / biotin---[acetyl-CoA-carboxylase] ligase
MPLNTQAIAEQRPANSIQYFPVTGSTMTEAARLAASGAPHGTVVLADEQTAGVGRFGRHWLSAPEAGIYCSILLRLPLESASLPIVTLALGVATAEAIEQATGIDCDLRWPNDVLVREYKVAGILAQLQDSCIVAGIGINVNQPELPNDLRTPATSLRMVAQKEFAREPIVVALLERLDSLCSLLVLEGPESVIRAFMNASSYALHRRVIYESEGGTKKGVTAGLNESGFLRVRDDSGAMVTLYNGGIRPDV